MANLRGKPIDVATVLAVLFVAASVPLIAARAIPREAWFLLACAAAVPLLALMPPRPSSFSTAAFVSSYGHWLLVVGVFFFGLTLELSDRDAERLLAANALPGIAVGLFALYQVVGIPRRWPGAGPLLVSFQREPFRFEQIGGYVRPTSVFLEPAWMGGYLTWVLVLAISLFFVAARPFWRVVALLCAGLSFLAIVSAVSWGAYADLLAAAVAGGITALRRRPLRRKSILLWTAAAAVLILFVCLSSPARRVVEAVQARSKALLETPLEAAELSPEVRDSSWIRYKNLVHTARVFRSQPLRGVGLGQYGAYSRFSGRAGEESVDPWCGWVAIAAQTGILGPFVLAGAIALVLIRWRSAPSRPGLLAVPALCALAIVQQVHTGSFIDLWWWFLLSLAAVFSGSRPP
ncbi:MAG: O-antigen ligase family protein [Thermoanaerobaculia bacterium]